MQKAFLLPIMDGEYWADETDIVRPDEAINELLDKGWIIDKVLKVYEGQGLLVVAHSDDDIKKR